jgi:hypothetical protein
MLNTRPDVRFPNAASRVGLQCHGWEAGVRGWLGEKITSTRDAVFALVRRLNAVSPDQWFLVGFVLLLLVFLFVLVVQPSSVGRGGR